ncbi:leucine-rich repeat-containing protein 27 [Astyanax mexicanus]|uniref:Leucine rich repeat containing 27 n=1 Tax=Astyanax mexicanus TaxID=7994 RepID=A0A8B9JR21_ASTMX|nr:leucine-rich repeat-containing protein 27 [Astyanax mexicanus]
MKALEEDMSDLHLSLDCGDSVEKWPSRISLSQQEDSSQYLKSHSLHLSRQSLNLLPDHALKHTQLQNLYLEGNKISNLPENMFSSLPCLVWLDLRHNQLTCLPAGIGQHRCLKTLLLEGNPITELPKELGNVITLRALNLRNCPISFPPQDVLQQGLAHIMQFLRRRSVAERPLRGSQPNEVSDTMPAVERLPLSEVVQSSVDLTEEADDSELQRFEELRQRMIQMERADLGYHTPASQTPCRLRAAGGDRSHRTHPLSSGREVQGRFPELPSSDERNWNRSEERSLAALKAMNEQQALLEQRRKDEDLLREWRKQARILQEQKILEQKEVRQERQKREENTPYATDSSCKEGDNGASDSGAQTTPQRSHMDTDEARVARDRELEQRIKDHVQMMKERRRRPRGPPGEEIQAAAQEMEQVKQLQLELAERKRLRDLEYRLTAFTADSFQTS